MLTPVNQLLKLEDMTDFMEDFSLESYQQISHEKAKQAAKKKETKKEQRQHFIS